MTARIAEVPEDDRLRRTGLRAGGDHFPVANAPSLLFAFDPGRADPLEAIRAFLHDAAPADGDIGVAHWFQARGFTIQIPISEEIEAANLIWAVVRAIARADATVVNLQVQ